MLLYIGDNENELDNKQENWNQIQEKVTLRTIQMQRVWQTFLHRQISRTSRIQRLPQMPRWRHSPKLLGETK